MATLQEQQTAVVKQFTEAYPEVGGIYRDASVHKESGRQFGEIISGKLAVLMHKQELTAQEQRFIDAALTSGARMVHNLGEKGFYPPKFTPVTVAAGQHLAKLTGYAEEVTEYSQIIALTGHVGNHPGLLRQNIGNPGARAIIEDAAHSTMNLVAEAFGTAPTSVRVDDYLYGNMVHIMSAYEAAEASAAQGE